MEGLTSRKKPLAAAQQCRRAATGRRVILSRAVNASLPRRVDQLTVSQYRARAVRGMQHRAGI
jgi:hypothetical protein